MPIDKTIDILAKEYKKKEVFSFIQRPVYNLDEMDGKPCMASLRFTGCYTIISGEEIDLEHPGMIYIDGKATREPIILSTPGFGVIVGMRIRGYATEYDTDYTITYKGARGTDGKELPEFSFTLHTQPRIDVGERYPEHDEVVLNAALEGAVLLKNENQALPLKRGSVVNPFGSGCAVYRLGCLGAGKINPRYGIGFREGLERYSFLKLNRELYHFYQAEEDLAPPEEMLEAARQQEDCAVIFISRTSSESQDMPKGAGGFQLTDGEREMIVQVSRHFTKKIAVLNTAYPIETGWVQEYQIDAVLWTGLPGMAGGRALAMLLEGEACPSGKLPNTWAKNYQDYPSSKNFLTKEDLEKQYGEPWKARYISTCYEEGLYVGYRYFDTFQKEAAYDLGHGLSYTAFRKEWKQVKQKGGTAFDAEIVVTNTGDCPGKETVLLYAHFEGGSLDQPDKRLVAFGKTRLLQPGETETLTLHVDESQLKSYSEKKAAWLIEAGSIVILMGGAAREAEAVYALPVAQEILVQQVTNRMEPPVPVEELTKENIGAFFQREGVTRAWTKEECDGKLPYKKEFSFLADDGRAETPKEGGTITFEEIRKDPSRIPSFVSQMTNRQLARLSCGGGTGWGLEDRGYAGRVCNTGSLKDYEIRQYNLADGNNGLNMNGPNIGFPVSTVMCASYNEELMYQEGRAIAKEAADMELHCILAPAMNLQRNPLCGRHCEYFSEDPYLTGRMAGQQSRGLEEGGIASCMKHFCANNAETLRNSNHSIITERTLREMYLRPFEYAFSVQMPASMMTGYNAVNGTTAPTARSFCGGSCGRRWATGGM
ncbi:MAG: hypothetical protein HFI41_11605 [Lachnospiraceae bacterium]|nr:hypothetical protein [Lachnospiraceae bacterium]